MKILKLKFKNINSLSGENEIDFTNPVFTNDGLFVITGKTGAGKSSILDAISLAFYGKTPRVEITGSENAVMTRGEKDCYAEIVFEVAGKKWKSSWKQERTRTGNLKPVSRQIADFEDKIIADQVRTCDTQIVEIIGLTFEQFTKVIMLAQGSFAAFLQANKNDKGELLEQITGTEIYAEISKRVFERNRIEKEKSDKISIELETIKILSDEEMQNLKDEMVAVENEKKQIDSELQKIEAAKKWLVDLGNLQTQTNAAKQKLPELEAKSKTANETFEKSENAFKTAKEEQKKQEPIFKKVRELDTKISEKEKLLRPIAEAISELEKSKNRLTQTIEKQTKERDRSQKLLAEKQDWAAKNKIYEELVSNYTAIEQENQLLVAAANEINKRNAEVADLQKELDLKKSDAKKATDDFNEKSEKLTAKTKELESRRSELAEVLGGRELAEFQSEKEKISTIGIQIKSLLDVENAMSKNQKEMSAFDEKIKQLDGLIAALSGKIETDKKTAVDLDKQINLLDENIKLTRTIQSLDEHRRNLKDGEACPLCGALEHPFALGNVPQLGEKEKELAVFKKQHQEIGKAIQEAEKNLAASLSDKDNALKNKAKEAGDLSENTAKQKGILAEIAKIDPDFAVPQGADKIERLHEFLTQKREALKKINDIIEIATHSEKQLVKLRDKEIPALQEEKQKAEKVKNETDTAQQLTARLLEEKQKSAVASQEKYKTENTAFLEKLQKYAVENMIGLKTCLDNWNNHKKQTEELINQITALGTDISLNNNELNSKTKLLDEKLTEKQTVETDKQKLADERYGIFAGKSVEEAEERLKRLLQNSEAEKTKAEKEKNDTHTEIEKTRAIVAEKEEELQKMREQKITDQTNEALQEAFNEKKINADGFLQKIGAYNQTLKSNAENLKNSSNKLKEREKQQSVCRKWSALNELIGSSDGKKYRNFAQALTFEHLISMSNRQLQKMSDRYMLKRTGDTSNPFELSVIDKYQNNEERTAQNLSGGENFIISLSLALGLSNMASKNMRIDTMFIDEGFGTLDSDYLDVALNALSNLQSEGKIIGVISHLTELKERIATHVEVLPSGNGHSTIQITN